MTSTTNLGLAITSILGIVAIVFLVVQVNTSTLGTDDLSEADGALAGEATRRMASTDSGIGSPDSLGGGECATSCSRFLKGVGGGSTTGDNKKYTACMKKCGFDIGTPGK